MTRSREYYLRNPRTHNPGIHFNRGDFMLADSAIYIDQLHLSNYALLLVVILLLSLIALLLWGIPRAIKFTTN